MLYNFFNPLPPLSFYQILVPKKERAFVLLYVHYLKLLASRLLRGGKRTPAGLALIGRAVTRQWGKQTLMGRLQAEFIKKNLSLSLLIEPAEGFAWLSQNLYPLSLNSATPVFVKIISPFSRFIGALNNQSPLFYQPFSTLIHAYAVLYVITVLKYRSMLEKAGIEVALPPLVAKLPLVKNEAKGVLKAASGSLFRIKIGFLLSLFINLEKSSNSAAYNRKKCRQAQKILNFFSLVKIFLDGLWYTLTIRASAPNRAKL